VVDKTEDIFQKSGALLKGHFLLTSGLHSPVYWEKFRVLQFPNYTEPLCRMIADHFRRQNVQVVAGPTTGGIILSPGSSASAVSSPRRRLRREASAEALPSVPESGCSSLMTF